MSLEDTWFNAKSSFTSLRIISNTTMEQGQRSEEHDCNDRLDAILVL